MRACDSSRVSDQPDNLSALHRFADVNQRSAHVKVRGDDSAAVVDIDHVSCQEKVVD
jgi:hypothetical protein